MCIAAYRPVTAVEEGRRCPLCGAPLPASPDDCLEKGCRGIRLPPARKTVWFCPAHTLQECMASIR